MPPQRWYRNRPDRAADETGSLARLPDRGRDESTRGPGTRDTYGTLRWLVEPSGAEALGCVRPVVSKCLADLAGEGIPRGQGNVHAQLPQDPYPNTVSPVHVVISRRMATNGPDFSAGAHVISDCRRRVWPGDKHSGCPRLSANGHPRSGKPFAGTTARSHSPLCRRLAPAIPSLSSGHFQTCPLHIEWAATLFQWCDLNRTFLWNLSSTGLPEMIPMPSGRQPYR
jgi:hypothetical protein